MQRLSFLADFMSSIIFARKKRMLEALLATLRRSSTAPIASGFAILTSGSASNKKVERYVYDTDAVVLGTDLALIRTTGEAAGNWDSAVIVGGGTCETYTYSGDVVATGAALAYWVNNTSGVGHNGEALFASGVDTGSTRLSTVQFYNYSSATWRAGSLGVIQRTAAIGFGNDVEGHIAGGLNAASSPINTNERFTWATETRTVAATLGAGNSLYSSTGFGDATVGFAIGVTTVAYTYAANTSVTGTAITSPRVGTGGASSSSVGVIAGANGSSASTSYINRYNIPARTDVLSSAGLVTGRNNVAGASSTPGGFPRP